MVRRVELNCRNGWAADLWEPAPEAARPAPDQEDTPLAAVAGGSAPEAAHKEPQIEAKEKEEVPAEPDAPLGVDVVVDQSPSYRPAASVASNADSAGAKTTPVERELILRARDINRIRQENRTRPTVAPIDLVAEESPLPPAEGPAANVRDPEPVETRSNAASEPLTESGTRASTVESGSQEEDVVDREAIAARLAPFTPVPPVPTSELRTDLLGLGANKSEAESRFDTVPPLDPTFSLPFRKRNAGTPLRAGFDADDAFDIPYLVERSGSAELDEPIGSALAPDGAAASGSALVAPEEASTVPAGHGREGRRRRFRDRRSIGREDSGVTTSPAPASQSTVSPVTRPIGGEIAMERLPASDRDHDTEPKREVRRDRDERAAVQPSLKHEVDFETTADDFGSTAAQEVSIALVDDPTYLPNVPRCCRTCRDFRPAEGGERGWCTNRWAFQHRRMVHGDEMPCWGAVGSWWVPNDDVWLDEWDVDHGQPTPLVDAMLARRESTSNPPVAPRLRRRGRT